MPVLTDMAREALARARFRAADRRASAIASSDVVLALADLDAHGPRLLEKLGVVSSLLAARVEAGQERSSSGGVPTPRLVFDPDVAGLISYAAELPKDGEAIATAHLWLALAEKSRLADLLGDAGISVDRISREFERDRPPGDASPFEGSGSAWFVQVDSTSAVPPYQQIIDQVAEAVATGRLIPGERLPTVRDLAGELGLAPGTVARAYAELESRGVVETRGPKGTSVATRSADPNGAVGPELRRLLRPSVVAAHTLGARADDLRAALEEAMRGIYLPRD